MCPLLLNPILSYPLLSPLFGGYIRKLRRDNPSKILIHLCLALLLSNLVYLIGMHDYSFDNSTICKVVAVLLHYSLLASLTWMAVEAFYMYLALILVFKTYFTNFILKCALFGWGVPLLIIVVTLAVDSTDNYGFINSGMCWLRNPAFYAAFVGPVCLILLVNCIAFVLVIRQLSNMASSKLNKTDRNR
ncbi:adhesion G-protein coupled receptor G4 [Elysia marginata]|uniref:Adhesion G-protein coupled receptor G4 n=1 Tax=Elysia marginata TaxID=1093978 RepID=A0AAV4HTN5_9GAST|nr:adhesion G-protein coupled receptor G4 [Elysia marginata]